MNEVLADRYELTSVLGAGGMGDVFRAKDRLLAREVAVKRLRVGDDEAERRFLREAQLQARVDHEHVCKVYEVSWDERHRPFIVMQLIHGQTLAAAARTLSIEEKVQALRAVCEGVHAAHRLGLIHRDLKPANVLVEPTARGLHPYVTDFGLARDTARKASLFTSSLAGTPQYMAPEQAAGSQQIDARTDVWGLGATLYEVLSGEMPFGTGTPFAVLQRVQREEPRPLGKLVPGLPRDLAVIVGKCLSKDPAARYRTARELGDDLRRFLDREPILARPPSLPLLARAAIRRHRAAAASIAVAAFVSLLFAGFSLVQRAQAQAHAEMAARFARDAQEIEQAMRLSFALPLHDTTAEARRAKERLSALEKEQKAAGKDLAGPALAAVGRGYLALRDFPAAFAKLKAAWDLGQRDPDTAAALGLAASAIYGEERAQAMRLPDAAARLRELNGRLHDQVVIPLRQAAGAVAVSPEFVEALLRLHEGALDLAEERLTAALARTPWLYDAHALLGELYRQRGVAQREKGNLAAAQAHLARAERELRIAADVGRSDALVQEDLCGVLIEQILARAGGDTGAPARAAHEACANALLAAPWLASARALQARIDQARAVAQGEKQ